MRMRDWSSDVCSSDLPFARIAEGRAQPARPSSRRRQSVLAQKNSQVIVDELVEPHAVAAAVGVIARATSAADPTAMLNMPVPRSMVANLVHASEGRPANSIEKPLPADPPAIWAGATVMVPLNA